MFLFIIFKNWIAPDLATKYLAGAVLLGAAPCTAMVFVWSTLTDGNPAFFIFFIAFGVCKLIHLPFDIAAPAGMIGASNFFELAVAIALFCTTSPTALATTVGVLTEVPVMLTLVKIANKSKGAFYE